MKKLVATVALGAALVLGSAGCGGSTSVVVDRHHRILLVAHRGPVARILRWNPGSTLKAVTKALDYGRDRYHMGAPGLTVSDGVWSPDGRSFAFEQDWRPVGTYVSPRGAIVVVRAGGRHVDVITTDTTTYTDGPPSWSPDGRQIVYLRTSSTRDFAIVDVPSGNKLIVPQDIGTSDPVWGKPGIAYHAYYAGGERIMLLNSATGRARLLARGPANGVLAWSPGGVLAVGEPTQIVLLAASGRVLQKIRIPSAAGPLCDIAWSPDGKQILLSTDEDKISALEQLWVGTVSTKRWQRLPTLPAWRNYTYECGVSWG